MSLPKPYYQDEWCTIYHGDCREVMPHLGRFDLLLTDPPYGIGVTQMNLGNGAKRIFRGENQWDSSPPQIAVERALEKATKQIVWGGNYLQLPVKRGWLFWDKQNGATGYADGELAWSNIDISLKKFSHLWHGKNAREKNETRDHPTQKPVALMQWCIRLADPVQSILDPFMGSGTTLVAAKNLNRRAVGIELEERYCEIAAHRLSQEVFRFEEPAPVEEQESLL